MAFLGWSSTATMADTATNLPKVEDIDLDGAEDGADETVVGEDGNPVKLTVRSCTDLSSA